MAKYLHFYDDFEKFKEDYADSETAVTTAFVCSGGTVATRAETPEEFAALLKQRLINYGNFSTLYDFSAEKFTSEANGKTIYVKPTAMDS